MNFDEYLKSEVSKSEIPEELSPENIALMLKNRKSSAKAHSQSGSSDSIGMKSKKSVIIMRSAAAVAACVGLTFAAVALNEQHTQPVTYVNTSGEVSVAADYSDVYKVLIDDRIKNGMVITDDEPDTADKNNVPYVEIVTPETSANPEGGDSSQTSTNTTTRYSLPMVSFDGVAKGDILEKDGTNLYYIAQNKVYAVSENQGETGIVFQTANENTTPRELYLNSDRLIVISDGTIEVPQANAADATASETAESSAAEPSEEKKTDETIKQSCIVVDIYDVSDKTAVKLLTTFKQNGSYISSAMAENKLYIVSDYSGYQAKPLENQQDLDNYVPAYYINDAKSYVQPSDIVMPSVSAGTNYTIVSGLDVTSETPLQSIKAVLGGTKSAYFTSGGIYTASALMTSSKGKTSVITGFATSDGIVSYRGASAVDGAVSASAFTLHDGKIFAASVLAGEKQSVNLFAFNEKMEITDSAKEIALGKNIHGAYLKNGKAYILTDESKPLCVSLDGQLSENQAAESGADAYLTDYSDGRMIGFGNEYDANGAVTGVRISMFADNGSGTLTEFAGYTVSGQSLSENETCGALFIDKNAGLIGIPTVSKDNFGTKNTYTLLSYSDTSGFTPIGTLEYTDVDKDFEFDKAAVEGDTFYALSGGRIVSARLSDLKVIKTLPLK